MKADIARKDISSALSKRKAIAADTLDDIADAEDHPGKVMHDFSRKRKAMHTTHDVDPFLSTEPDSLPEYSNRRDTSNIEDLSSVSRRSPDRNHFAQGEAPYSEIRPGVTRMVNNLTRAGASGNTRMNTRFKPPSRSHDSPVLHGGTPVTTPLQLTRKYLGSTRPTSLLARRSLQTDWSKFSETNAKAMEFPQAKSKPLPTVLWSAPPVSRESEESRNARRSETLKKLQEQDQVILPVEQNQKALHKTAASNWMFD